MDGVNDSQIKAALGLIGNRLRKLRDKKGWSQDGVAKTAKMPRTLYRAIECAERGYGIEAFVKVLDALDIDPIALIPEELPRKVSEKPDLVRRLAIEQLERVLDEGTDEDRQIALGSISRWYKALPKKRPE